MEGWDYVVNTTWNWMSKELFIGRRVASRVVYMYMYTKSWGKKGKAAVLAPVRGLVTA